MVNRKIEEQQKVYEESLRRREAKSAEEAQLAPPHPLSQPQQVTVDMSAITGIKRKKPPPNARSRPVTRSRLPPLGLSPLGLRAGLAPLLGRAHTLVEG